MADGGVVVSLAVAATVFAVTPEGNRARLPPRVAREAGGRFIYPLRLLFLFVLSVY